VKLAGTNPLDPAKTIINVCVLPDLGPSECASMDATVTQLAETFEDYIGHHELRCSVDIAVLRRHGWQTSLNRTGHLLDFRLKQRKHVRLFHVESPDWKGYDCPTDVELSCLVKGLRCGLPSIIIVGQVIRAASFNTSGSMDP
jgi:hypothetical protein